MNEQTTSPIYPDNGEEKQERVRSLFKQQRQLLRNISILEEQRNQYGGAHVPLDILNQLDNNKKCLEEVQQELEEMHRAPGSTPPPPIPFINREDEIKLILSYHAPAYFLLDAPTGYGKTKLMQELKCRFEERGWAYIYVSVEGDSLDDLEDDLARGFDPTCIGVPPRNPRLPMGAWLGGMLRRFCEDIVIAKRKEGLVLLIDLDKSPSLPVAEELLQKIIPQIQECLRPLDFFARGHNRFRVVLAGRHLPSRVRNTPLKLSILQLSPFDYEVIRASSREYLPNHAEESLDQISAHLLHMTGGHPGCMARVLETYKRLGQAPDRFLEFCDETVRELVKQTVDKVHSDTPNYSERLCKTLDRLSIHRHLDYAILRCMIEKGEIPKAEDEHCLADELTATYLFTRKGRLLRDDITRRLLALRLRHENPQNFAAYCLQARDMCAERLREPGIQMPEKWTIEYLFQSLQQHANDTQRYERRTEAREAFLEEDVPLALRMFVDVGNMPKDVTEEQNALLQELEEDWEFRFVVNYYLREDQYNDSPYDELLKQVERFFEQKQEKGGNRDDSRTDLVHRP